MVCVCQLWTKIKGANYGQKHKLKALLVLKGKSTSFNAKYSVISLFILSLSEIRLCGSSKLNWKGFRNELVNTVHIFQTMLIGSTFNANLGL